MKYIGNQLTTIKRKDIVIIGIGMFIFGLLLGFGIGYGVAS